jgi:hypothetical protein
MGRYHTRRYFKKLLRELQRRDKHWAIQKALKRILGMRR